MSPYQNALIIKCAEDICEAEIALTKNTATWYGFKTTTVEVQSRFELTSKLIKLEESDYKCSLIYLCGHADSNSFGDAEEGCDIHWDDFASDVCSTNILEPNAILYLACCKGGLSKVAFNLLHSCEQIQYVCGTTDEALPADLATAFGVFIYRLRVKNDGPNVAISIATQVTGKTFKIFDREEVELDINYTLYKEKREKEDQEYIDYEQTAEPNLSLKVV